MRCHVVLWIPTLVYTDFKETTITEVEKNLSDVAEEVFVVKVELVKEKDFRVSARKDNAYKEIVYLEREQKSSNGLIEFGFESTSDENSAFHFNAKEFPEAIYHIIKSFYHEHDFHEPETDSSWKPFVSEKLINIKDVDNAAIMHYLQVYGNFISNCVKNIKFLINRVREKEDSINLEGKNQIQDWCLKAKGHDVYMGVLYRSKYNKKCKTDSKIRTWRHIACNIENGLNYIRTVEGEYGDYKQQAFVSKTTKDARNAILISSILSGISILLAIGSVIYAHAIAKSSSYELQTVKDSLKQEMISIPNDLSLINSRLDTLFLDNQIIEESIIDLSKRQRAVQRTLENE